MKPKWKAFTSWLILPYLASVVIALLSHYIALAPLMQWKVHAYVLGACVFPAGFGTIILWLLPIRQAWVGIAAGPILALGAIVLWVMLRVTFWGGFEANAGTAATAMILLLPSCFAGAYAGFLRYRESQSQVPR